jgi:hypothetical protein
LDSGRDGKTKIYKPIHASQEINIDRTGLFDFRPNRPINTKGGIRRIKLTAGIIEIHSVWTALGLISTTKKLRQHASPRTKNNNNNFPEFTRKVRFKKVPAAATIRIMAEIV